MSTFKGPMNVKGSNVVIQDGGVVTQITTAATAVTLNKPTGEITTVVQNIAAAGEVQFTVNCSAVVINTSVISIPTVAIRSGSVGGTTVANVTAVANGSFQVTLSNLHATVAETGTLIICFLVLGGSAVAVPSTTLN